jgi:translation initiation factor IF-3
MAHTEVGQELLQRFAAGCGDIVSIDKAPLLDGRNMTMMLSPKKTDNKNKSKGTETNG